ncbi:glycosyltransferase [Salinibacterium sp. ZJ454]|uniref:glycosyltransferase n=1 Tax=Salinibacterium sp. ZJ454 TaxID=2708339 RepID=UPI00141E2C3E|nr:glycosyltransferase [Salinibacterium sp. ZJ454]
MTTQPTTALTAPLTRPLTIVVPIYDHWESLSRCLDSLLSFTDPSLHTVLLVNDCGPNADEIEIQVLEKVAAHSQFKYFRNHENLGFVRTCNRAVFELDRSDNDVLLLNSDAAITAGALEEMGDVLHSAEHHGVVCARSNHATIASVPVERHIYPTDAHLDAASAQILHRTIAESLPRYYLTPVAHGFCFLVRRHLIENHGLFDTIFAAGYNEENDFSLRINAMGYSALIANRAFVFHLGSASFGAEKRQALEAKNSQILLDRYPFYRSAVHQFIRYGYSAADTFAEAIAMLPNRQPKILIDIHHLSLVYNGSTRYALAFLELLANSEFGRTHAITITAQQGAIDFFSLADYGFPVVPYGAVAESFDLGIALAPVNDLPQLFTLNRHCARWLVSHFDMIASRSWELRLSDPLRPLVIENAFRFADSIITLSDFSMADAQSYYPGLQKHIERKTEAVALGSTRNALGTDARGALPDQPLAPRLEEVIERANFIVVMGNFYPHKQVHLALTALRDAQVDVVAFGPVKGASDTTNLTILQAGNLPEAHFDRLIAASTAVVFPSAYEGFGLPIADALDAGKPVIAFDTEVSREVVDKLHAADSVRFFNRFTDLAAVVQEVAQDTTLRQSASDRGGQVRKVAAYNHRLMEMAEELLSTPVDVAHLEERFHTLVQLQEVIEHRDQNTHHVHARLAAVEARLHDVLTSRTVRIGRRIASILAPIRSAVKALRWVRRPA